MVDFKNKYTVIVIVVVLLLISYVSYTYMYRENVKPSKKGKKKPVRSTKGKKGAGKGAGKSRKGDSKKSEALRGDPVADDAEELYNLVHEEMCQNMQIEQFLEVSKDLADERVYIDLRQLYNSCADSKIDPSDKITVEQYKKILDNE
jgi:hypothetical protein